LRSRPTVRDNAERLPPPWRSDPQVKLLIWNIRHGGSDAAGIAEAIAASGVHVAVLCEYHLPKVEPGSDSGPKTDVASRLKQAGFEKCLDSAPAAGTNGILVTSKRPLSRGDVRKGPPGQEARWLHVRVEMERGELELGCAHIPVFKRGKKGEKSDKEKYWQWLLETEVRLRDRSCLLVGDWNTGLNTVDRDVKGARFHNWKEFEALGSERGWRDALRELHERTSVATAGGAPPGMPSGWTIASGVRDSPAGWRKWSTGRRSTTTSWWRCPKGVSRGSQRCRTTPRWLWRWRKVRPVPRLKQDVAGNAGVMFVAAELGRRGLLALPTVRNTEGVDLIASEPLGGKSVSIQVKTTQGPEKKWLLGAKNEKYHTPTLFYVFVNLGLPGTLPDYHVVPSKVVADTISKGHAQWLATPAKGGKAHHDNAMREFRDRHSEYRDQWDALGLDLTQ
jgi:exonuclease III